MTAGRLLAAWIVVASSITALCGVLVYSTGVFVRHADAPSETLLGWDAVRYLCPRVALGLASVTVVTVLVVWILIGRRSLNRKEA